MFAAHTQIACVLKSALARWKKAVENDDVFQAASTGGKKRSDSCRDGNFSSKRRNGRSFMLVGGGLSCCACGSIDDGDNKRRVSSRLFYASRFFFIFPFFCFSSSSVLFFFFISARVSSLFVCSYAIDIGVCAVAIVQSISSRRHTRRLWCRLDVRITMGHVYETIDIYFFKKLFYSLIGCLFSNVPSKWTAFFSKKKFKSRNVVWRIL